MRWFWIDRFVEFTSGQSAVAIKNVSLAEDHLHDHFPDYPVMPHSLIIEGLAQTGGILVGECQGFEKRIVLAKVAKAAFHDEALPGDTLTYSVRLDEIGDDGARVSGTSGTSRGTQAEVELFFAHPDERMGPKDLWLPQDLLTSMMIVGLFDVGRRADGSPLEIHPYFRRAVET